MVKKPGQIEYCQSPNCKFGAWPRAAKNMSKYVKIHLNTFEYVFNTFQYVLNTFLNISKNIKISIRFQYVFNTFKYVKIYQNISWYIIICQDMSKNVPHTYLWF